jgi:hypothetical protein
VRGAGQGAWTRSMDEEHGRGQGTRMPNDTWDARDRKSRAELKEAPRPLSRSENLPLPLEGPLIALLEFPVEPKCRVEEGPASLCLSLRLSLSRTFARVPEK